MQPLPVSPTATTQTDAGTGPGAGIVQRFAPYVVIHQADIATMVSEFGFDTAAGALLVWSILQREAVRVRGPEFTCPLSRLVVATGATRKTIVHRLKLLESAGFVDVKRAKKAGSKEAEPNVYRLRRGHYSEVANRGSSPGEPRGSFQSGESPVLKATEGIISGGDIRTPGERIPPEESAPPERLPASAGVDAAAEAPCALSKEEDEKQRRSANRRTFGD